MVNVSSLAKSRMPVRRQLALVELMTVSSALAFQGNGKTCTSVLPLGAVSPSPVVDTCDSFGVSLSHLSDCLWGMLTSASADLFVSDVEVRSGSALAGRVSDTAQTHREVLPVGNTGITSNVAKHAAKEAEERYTDLMKSADQLSEENEKLVTRIVQMQAEREALELEIETKKKRVYTLEAALTAEKQVSKERLLTIRALTTEHEPKEETATEAKKKPRGKKEPVNGELELNPEK